MMEYGKEERPNETRAEYKERLAKMIAKRNTLIDNSPYRADYILMLASRKFSSGEMEEFALEKGEKISSRVFRDYRSKMPQECFRELSYLERMTADGVPPEGIDSIEMANNAIAEIEARIKSHAEVDDKSPIARREQNQLYEIKLKWVKYRDELLKEKKGISRPEEEGKKKVRSINEFSDDEFTQELKRIGKLEVGAEKSRLQAEREGRFKDKEVR